MCWYVKVASAMLELKPRSEEAWRKRSDLLCIRFLTKGDNLPKYGKCKVTWGVKEARSFCQGGTGVWAGQVNDLHLFHSHYWKSVARYCFQTHVYLRKHPPHSATWCDWEQLPASQSFPLPPLVASTLDSSRAGGWRSGGGVRNLGGMSHPSISVLYIQSV